MTGKEATQIIAAWLESSKWEKGQLGYIEGWFQESDVEAFRMAIEALKSDRPKGEWIVYSLVDEGSVEVECPECGDTFVRAVDYRPHFCENCGADMRGDKE